MPSGDAEIPPQAHEFPHAADYADPVTGLLRVIRLETMPLAEASGLGPTLYGYPLFSCRTQ